MSQGDDIGILMGVGIAEYGMSEEQRSIGMEIITSFVTRHHEVGISIGCLSGNNFGETQQGKIGGDDANKLFVGLVKGFAVGGYHAVDRQLQRVTLVEIDGPGSLPLLFRLLIPYLIKVFVLLFNNSRYSVCFANGIDREITTVLGECLWFKTDRATINMAVKLNDIVGIGQERIGLHTGCHIPGS